MLKPIFFLNDPELMHDSMVRVGATLGKYSLGRKLTWLFLGYKHRKLEQDILGIHFKNPIGLSAGFDKNAELTDVLPYVGFGFIEVGSITGEPCTGNPKPRLWRLPKSKSLAVYYGLKNDGCDVISKRLEGKKCKVPLGVNVAMTNSLETIDTHTAINDYTKAFKVMEKVATYITVNISCPNTCGGQPFVTPHKLDYLFDILDEIPTKKPIFIKLSPDLSESELNDLLDVVHKHRIHGIICTNLTKQKENNPLVKDSFVPAVGGLSGKPVEELSNRMLSYIYKREGKRYMLIGLGGVFTAEDAYKKIRLGASLVQLITGMIFEGPQVISEINQGLVKLLDRDGFKSVDEARGVDSC
ncbi:MAG TPA: quinone-dependent dihydroorotate dehydrogenase [Candidatus Paceibacterota bacterium]|nr:quinone-dependent dihydroorotate dehydrogenase [Candidatus Paceibacterota bacterium]